MSKKEEKIILEALELLLCDGDPAKGALLAEIRNQLARVKHSIYIEERSGRGSYRG